SRARLKPAKSSYLLRDLRRAFFPRRLPNQTNPGNRHKPGRPFLKPNHIAATLRVDSPLRGSSIPPDRTTAQTVPPSSSPAFANIAIASHQNSLAPASAKSHPGKPCRLPKQRRGKS